MKLTPTEFELLHQLMLHAGKVMTHRTLLRSVWGPEYGEETDYLRVYVRQLRLKIEQGTFTAKVYTDRTWSGLCFSFTSDSSTCR